MKKKVLIVLTALVALSLSACSDTPAATAPQDAISSSAVAFVDSTKSPVESSSESTSPFEQVKEPSAAIESVQEKQPIANNTPADIPAENAQISTAQHPITIREPEQAPQTPVSTEPAAPSASHEPTPPAQTPEPTPEPAQPAFDISNYVAYAKSYAQGIGLTLDSSAVSCWDDPITADGSCIYLVRDIRDRLDWYQASGYTAFWVWSVDNGGSNYQIYIGYA